MKHHNKTLGILTIGLTLALSSCGFSTAVIVNANTNTTQVQLQSNNFRVIDKVSGASDATYILLIGGLNSSQLYQNAYSAMMEKADLKGSSRAITNVVTEEHVGGFFPFYFTRTINVSGNVIEFTK